MFCSVFGEKSLARGRVEGVAEVGEDDGAGGGEGWSCGIIVGRVEDEANSELVGGAFEAEGDSGAGRFDEGHGWEFVKLLGFGGVNLELSFEAGQ